MNTRSTKRSTLAPKTRSRGPASKTSATTRVTRRHQKVAETQPQIIEVFETIGTTEEVVEHESIDEREQQYTEEEGVEHTEEEVIEVQTQHILITQEDGHHSQQVFEEQYEEQQQEEEEEQQQYIQVNDGEHHIVVGTIDQSSDQLSVHELSADLSTYWTKDKNQLDGKLEFVCKWLLCSFRTQSECSIRKHVVKHLKPYQCSFVGCGERFVETQNLLEHFSATHMDTNAFKCTFADCEERFRDIKSLTEHRVSHVSHTTQLIKANKDYKQNKTEYKPTPVTTTQAIDLQQIFGHTFDNTTTIELTGTMVTDQSYIVVTNDMLGGDGQTHTVVVTGTTGEERYRNKQRMNSVIRCPISSLTDDIVEGNDNYVKCRTNDGKFWYKCLWDYCDYGNINEGIIRRHVLKHEFPHKCSFEACNKSFTTLSEMAEHRQMIHSGPNPYVCDWPECPEAYPGIKELTEHKRNHLIEANARAGTVSGQNRQKKVKPPVPPKPFMCTFGKCNMHYMTEDELELHKQIHSGDRPFKCQYPECTFAAKSKDKLQIHHSRHSMDKQFRCLWPTCDKSFTIAEQLRRHRKLHTNRDPLMCEFTGCDLVFQTATDLEKHLRRHIGLDDSAVESMNPMPYKCNFGLCKMHFQTKDELQKHNQSHRGDRFYKCNYDNKCSYSAKTLDKLNAHLRYHSGERPFKCDFIGCHQDFIQSHHLARHRKSHFGSEPVPQQSQEDIQTDEQIQCQDCEQCFANESDLEQHINSEHPLTDQESDEESEVSPHKTLKRKYSTESQSKNDESVNDLSENDLKTEDTTQEKKLKVNQNNDKVCEQTKQPSKQIACTFGKCIFRCSTDQELTEHTEKSHSGDRPFACEFDNCTFKANRKDKLVLHNRRHTGEKPFKCDWNECTKCFISKEQLNRHNLSHFKSKQALNKLDLMDKDFDKTLQELEELLQENDNTE